MEKILKVFTKQPRRYDMTDLYHVTKQVRTTANLIWLTIVGYIVYLEIYKELVIV